MITSITREFDLSPNIVGINTTDNLSTITSAGYFFGTQGATIEQLTNGVWKWDPGDLILMFYAVNLLGFFTYDAGTDSFVALTANGGLSSTLPSGDIFVGNASNIATPIAMSGDVTINNAGVATISNNVVTYAKLDSTVAKLSVTVLSSAELNALYTTSQLLVPAAGSGTFLILDHLVVDYQYAVSQTTGGGNIFVQFGSAAHGANVPISEYITASRLNTLNETAIITVNNTFNAVYTIGSYDTGLYLACDTAPFSAGGGGATIYTYYKVLTPA